MSDTQLAVKPKTLKDLIASPGQREQFAAALPRHLSVDRFVRTLQTTLLRNPDLEKADKASFFLAALNLSALGIEADGRRGHLIPFENKKKGITEVQLIIDYKGLAELVRRSGEVSDLHADIVCENDEFSYCYGTGSHLKHRPARKDRGEMVEAYSYVRLKDGTDSFEVMNLEEVLQVRDESQGYKSAVKYQNDSHPWIKHFREMAKKTVFRRHSKWLPLSPELREKIEIEDEVLPEINVTPAKPEPIKPTFPAKVEVPASPIPPEDNIPFDDKPQDAPLLAPLPEDLIKTILIKGGAYGLTEEGVLEIAKTHKKAPRGATSLIDMSDPHLAWLNENLAALVEGKK